MGDGSSSSRSVRRRQRRRLPLLGTAVAAILVLLDTAPLAAGDAPKQGKPQVWDGGAWHEFDEEIHHDEPRPYPPASDSWKRNDTTIHVSISSFRDHRCPKTLFNLFTKARHPERVHVGVVQQNNEGDVDCLIAYCSMMKKEKGDLKPIVGEKTPVRSGHAPALENCPYGKQVSILRVSAEEAKGPTYGRYLQSKLIGGDKEFCMQTDAHMDFLFHWDAILLDMWGLVDNEYAVLTTYVPRVEEMGLNVNERWEVPHICRAFFTPGDGMVRNEQAKAVMWLTRPKLTSTWAAGFAFNKCHADRRTPYDPHLPSLFDGEEFSKYARLWTRGYDTYTPHRSVVYHDYTHNAETAPASSWARKMHELRRAHDRLKVLLGYPDAKFPRNSSEAHAFLGQWDLGTRRSLAQLAEFTGVDTRKKEVTKSSCQRLVWVPFDREEEGIDDDEDPMLPASFEHAGYRARLHARRRAAAEEEEDWNNWEEESRWSAKRHPALVTFVWLGLGVLVGFRLRRRKNHHHTRHTCGATALASQWGGEGYHQAGGSGGRHGHGGHGGQEEGHYVSAADHV